MAKADPQAVALFDPEAFHALGALAEATVLTRTSLDLSGDRELTYDEWEAMGAGLGAVNRSCSWWVGDWLLYGEGTFGERWAQAEAATGLARQTLENRMSVCKRVPPTRRRPGLPFGCHDEVAAMDARDQTYWLDRCEKNGWTREDLRHAIREKRRRDKGEKTEVLPPDRPSSPEQVLEMAKRVVGSAREYGSDYLVPREEMAKLRAAVGMEA